MKDFLNILNCLSGSCVHKEHIIIPILFIVISFGIFYFVQNKQNKSN